MYFVMILFICVTLTGCFGGDGNIKPGEKDTSIPEEYREVVKKSLENPEALTEAERDKLGEYDESLRKQENKKNEDDYNLVTELVDLEARKIDGSAVVASCNAIENSSTCVDYVGSIFTVDHARLSCSDMGDFSTKPCPTGTLGGCNVGNGIPSDLITWFYPEGAEAMNADELKNAQKSCEATPTARWISGR